MKQHKKFSNSIDHYDCLVLERGKLEELVYSTKFDKEIFLKIVLNLNRTYKFEREQHNKIYEAYDKSAEYKRQIDNLESKVHDLNQQLEISKLKQKACEDQLKDQAQENIQIKFFNQLQSQREFHQRRDTDFLHDEIKDLRKDLKYKDKLIQYLKKQVLDQAKQQDQQNFFKSKKNTNQTQKKYLQIINDKEKKFLRNKVQSCAQKIELIDKLEDIPLIKNEDNQNNPILDEILDQLSKIETDCQSLWENIKNTIKDRVQGQREISMSLLTHLHALKPYCLNIKKQSEQYITCLTAKTECESNDQLKKQLQQILVVMQYNQKIIENLTALFNVITKKIERILILQNEIQEKVEDNTNNAQNVVQTIGQSKIDIQKKKSALPSILQKQINEDTQKSEFFNIYKGFLQRNESNNIEFILGFLKSINTILHFHYSSYFQPFKLKFLMPEILINKASNMVQNEEKLLIVCQDLIQKFVKIINEESKINISKNVCEENQLLLEQMQQHISNTKSLFGEFQKVVCQRIF